MPNFLLELFSEEIPARMQADATAHLQAALEKALAAKAKMFSTPRRLAAIIENLPEKQPDISLELKGPKVDAPAAALDGFLRKTGLTKEQLKVEKTPKGDGKRTAIAPTGPLTIPMANVRDVRGAVAATTPKLDDVRAAYTGFRGDWYLPTRFRTMYDAVDNGGVGKRIVLVEDASDAVDLSDKQRMQWPDLHQRPPSSVILTGQ